MKTQAITLPTGNIFDPKLEEMLQKGDIELKILVEKQAKTFAQRNLPALTGDNLSNYLEGPKAGFEKLIAEAVHYLQPLSHFPEAKVDASYAKKKVTELELEINEKEAQNRIDENTMREYSNNSIRTRIRWGLLSTALITIGEILFNTKAFQVTGESLLFALILSICISFAVFAFAHVTPVLLKKAKNRIQRIAYVGGSLFLVTGLFTALAILRSEYLAAHNVQIKPFYFIIINLFFFIVSSLVSYFIMPTWEEIKQNAKYLKLQNDVRKRIKEIKQLKGKVEEIHDTIQERTKIRIRIAHYAIYAIERIRKMYKESVGLFKTTNLINRNDNTPPDCFSDDPDDLDVGNDYYSLIQTTDNLL